MRRRVAEAAPLALRRLGCKPGARAPSAFRGVTLHCRTSRYEVHIWDGGKQARLRTFLSASRAVCLVACCALLEHVSQLHSSQVPPLRPLHRTLHPFVCFEVSRAAIISKMQE